MSQGNSQPKSLTTVDKSVSGNLTALNSTVVLVTNGVGTGIFEITGTWVGTITFEGSNNNFSTVQSVTAIYLGGIQTQAATTTTNGYFSVLTAGFAKVRANMTAYTSGTAAVLANGSSVDRIIVPLQGNPNNNQTLATLNTGSAIVGKVGIDQTTPGTTNATSLAQIGANTVSTGVGASGTGTQRVVTATDSTIGTVTTLTGTTSLTPGTAATNLGKAEDAVHTSGDTGVFSLGVANVAQTALVNADGDYTPMATDLKGNQYTALRDTLGNSTNSAATGFLKVTDEPHQLFYDSFDTTLDTTNYWNVTSAGGGVAPLVTLGVMTMGTGTTSGGYSVLQSIPTFKPSIPGWVVFSDAVALPDGAAPTANSYRYWGSGTIPTTPTAANPIIDGYGFELNTDGKLRAVVYAGGTRTVIADLSSSGTNTQPLNATYHRYIVQVRTDRTFFYIDTIDSAGLVASTSFQSSQSQILPKLFISIAGAAIANTQFQCTGAAVSDTGKNTIQISDGATPWRKQTVKGSNIAPVASDSAAVVALHPLSSPSLLVSGGNTSASMVSQQLNSTLEQILAQILLQNASLGLGNADTNQNIFRMLDNNRQEIVSLQNDRSRIKKSRLVTLTASVAETTLIVGDPQNYIDILAFVAINTSATAVRLDFRDATGATDTTPLYLPAGDMRGFSLGGVAIPQTTIGNNWTVQSSASVTDIRVYALYSLKAS